MSLKHLAEEADKVAEANKLFGKYFIRGHAIFVIFQKSAGKEGNFLNDKI